MERTRCANESSYKTYTALLKINKQTFSTTSRAKRDKNPEKILHNQLRARMTISLIVNGGNYFSYDNLCPFYGWKVLCTLVPMEIVGWNQWRGRYEGPYLGAQARRGSTLGRASSARCRRCRPVCSASRSTCGSPPACRLSKWSVESTASARRCSLKSFHIIVCPLFRSHLRHQDQVVRTKYFAKHNLNLEYTKLWLEAKRLHNLVRIVKMLIGLNWIEQCLI